jgi:hypothetical protein
VAVETLRPTSTDALTGWEANPHLKLDEVVNESNTDALSASAEYVATSTNAHTFTLGFPTFVLGSDVVASAQAYVRWRGNVQMQLLTTGASVLASVSINSGGTVQTDNALYTGTLTQQQIDDLQVRINSLGAQSPNARVGWVFIYVTHNPAPSSGSNTPRFRRAHNGLYIPMKARF